MKRRGLVHITFSVEGRLRTPDGRYVFVLAHPHCGGPEVYRDRAMTRYIDEWYDDPGILHSVEWWMSKRRKRKCN